MLRAVIFTLRDSFGGVFYRNAASHPATIPIPPTTENGRPNSVISKIKYISARPATLYRDVFRVLMQIGGYLQPILW